jgi:hypothetical protein
MCGRPVLTGGRHERSGQCNEKLTIARKSLIGGVDEVGEWTTLSFSPTTKDLKVHNIVGDEYAAFSQGRVGNELISERPQIWVPDYGIRVNAEVNQASGDGRREHLIQEQSVWLVSWSRRH